MGLDANLYQRYPYQKLLYRSAYVSKGRFLLSVSYLKSSLITLTLGGPPLAKTETRNVCSCLNSINIHTWQFAHWQKQHLFLSFWSERSIFKKGGAICPTMDWFYIFSDLQLWSLISLQPLDQNQCLVPHLNDLFHICLDIKAKAIERLKRYTILAQIFPYF